MVAKNILLLSYRDYRGDGVAAYNLAKYLHDSHYNVSMVVSEKTKTDRFIVTTYLQEFKNTSLPLRMYKRAARQLNKKFFENKTYKFSDFDNKYDFFVDQEITSHLSAEAILNSISFTPDLVLVASMHDLVNTTELAKINELTKAPIYLIMMDMFPLTGGCHHAWDCKGFEFGCSSCPAILNDAFKDRAAKNFKLKIENVRKANMQVIAGSGRALGQAKNSLLFKDQKVIHNINGFVDQAIFNTHSRQYAKHLFGLNADDKVIFTGAEHVSNERKGFKYFLEAIRNLYDIVTDAERLSLIVMIAAKAEQNQELLTQIPFRIKFIEFIQDDRLLSVAYQAAEVFVCSSIEDPGPITVSQAMACGTPVAGFYMGAISNLVINNENGFKAPLRDSVQLAAGILHLLRLSNEEFASYSKNAVEQVAKHSSKTHFLHTIDEILNN